MILPVEAGLDPRLLAATRSWGWISPSPQRYYNAWFNPAYEFSAVLHFRGIQNLSLSRVVLSTLTGLIT